MTSCLTDKWPARDLELHFCKNWTSSTVTQPQIKKKRIIEWSTHFKQNIIERQSRKHLYFTALIKNDICLILTSLHLSQSDWLINNDIWKVRNTIESRILIICTVMMQKKKTNCQVFFFVKVFSITYQFINLNFKSYLRS